MKRFLDTVQLLLVLASTTAVVDATLAVPTEPAGYHSTEGGRGEPPTDRRFGDLARLDRRSREDRQRALGRSRTADPLELFARVD
jgi:hypothetical protein